VVSGTDVAAAFEALWRPSLTIVFHHANEGCRKTFGILTHFTRRLEPQTSADSLKESGSGEKGNEETGPVRIACMNEIEKFWAGEQRAGRCLRERDSADLSPALANRRTTPR
jgi:hypothetical protein